MYPWTTTAVILLLVLTRTVSLPTDTTQSITTESHAAADINSNHSTKPKAATDFQTRKARIGMLHRNAETDTMAELGNAQIPEQDIPHASAAVLKKCALRPADRTVTEQIKTVLDSGAKMIKFHLSIKHSKRQLHFDGFNKSQVYQPFFWVRSTGRHGTRLLLLRPEYDVLSLTTLKLGVIVMNVPLIEEPSYCLNKLSYTDIEILIRELVMNDFQNVTGESVQLNPTDSVCNMHIKDMDGVADFRYLCCQRSESNHISCNYLKSDIWLNVLLVVILVLKVVIALFSPRLIPDTLYRLKHLATPYIHKLQPDKPLIVKTVITENPDIFKNVKNTFRLSKFKKMKTFKTTLHNMVKDVPYDLTINRVHLRVKSGRLLSEDCEPTGLFRTIYDSFFKCKIHKRTPVVDCCNANVFLFSICHVSWYTLLKSLMTTLLVIILTLPWVLRMYVYFEYEDEEMDRRKFAASQKSLRFYFPGNVTLLLTPLHVVFVIIYVLLSLESLIFGVMSMKMKEQFKFVLRKCFRDMREVNQFDIIGWVINVSIKPCTIFGGLGICIGLVSWTVTLPFLILISSFYMFPTLNITVRLMAHFMVYLFPRNVCSEVPLFATLSKFIENMEKKLEMEELVNVETLEKNEVVLRSKRRRLQQLIIISMCLLSMYSVIFLVTEFVSFVVEIFVYTLMGLIINASMTLTYISLVCLLGVYGNDCFGFVSKTFTSFNKTMNGAILALGKDEVENDIYCDDETQQNIAFRVKNERASPVEIPVQLTSVDGIPRWQVSRLVLFLNKKDRPMIPKSFYFKSCRMPFYSVPGELMHTYMKATVEFGMILLFLMFVLIVVLAFGDSYKISATNKMMATIAGGFLPFMLINVVFKAHIVPKIDNNNMMFQVCLHNLLDMHTQTWPIYDIDVVQRIASINISTAKLSDIPEESNQPDTDVCEETTSFINKGGKDICNAINEQAIDLLIHITGKIDRDDFPGMIINGSNRNHSASTNMLVLEPEEKEMNDILRCK